MDEQDGSPVNADDVRIVDAVNPSMDLCPTCSYTNWYIVQGPGAMLPILPMGTPLGELPMPKGHALVTLACQRCGYLKSHIKLLFDGYAKGLRESEHDGH